MNLWQFLTSNFNEVLTLTGQHLWMVLVAITVAVVIGVPAGVLITRKPALEKVVLALPMWSKPSPVWPCLVFSFPFL